MLSTKKKVFRTFSYKFPTPVIFQIVYTESETSQGRTNNFEISLAGEKPPRPPPHPAIRFRPPPFRPPPT